MLGQAMVTNRTRELATTNMRIISSPVIQFHYVITALFNLQFNGALLGSNSLTHPSLILGIRKIHCWNYYCPLLESPSSSRGRRIVSRCRRFCHFLFWSLLASFSSCCKRFLRLILNSFNWGGFW